MEARGQLFRDKHKVHFTKMCPIANNHPQYFHEGNQFYRQPNRVLILEDIILYYQRLERYLTFTILMENIGLASFKG